MSAALQSTKATAPVLQACALTIGHGQRRVGTDLSFAMVPGEVLCLLGPNGSGKTTLFRTLLGLLAPLAGEVRVLGEPVAEWPRSAFARHVGYVPQAHAGIFPYTVEDVVLMGRAARIGRFAAPAQQDREHALHCLHTLGIAHLRQRIYTAISGGERQLVLIARALAQEPVLLVMDEPTASLDFGNQIRVLEHIAQLRQQGMAVLLSTHQPDHALRIGDRIALLGGGRLVAIGTPASTATPERLATLYGVSERAVAASLVASLNTSPPSPSL
ncbi:ABC transporter ATP-binding protein [Simplicispira piscis]